MQLLLISEEIILIHLISVDILEVRSNESVYRKPVQPQKKLVANNGFISTEKFRKNFDFQRRVQNFIELYVYYHCKLHFL